ncbi:MAG: peroxiredoxin family protein [Deferrisomatales bacterium]
MPVLPVLLVLVALALPATAATPSPAPPWELADLQGATHRLADWRGRWVLLKLGTTQCANCALELEEMAKVSARIAAAGVEVVDVYLRESPKAVGKYLEQKRFAFRPLALCDTRGDLIRPYRVALIPHLVLVDPEGGVAWQGFFTPGHELAAILEAQVGAKP